MPQRHRIWTWCVPAVMALAGLLFAMSATAAGQGARSAGVTRPRDVVQRQNDEVRARTGTVQSLRDEIDLLTRAHRGGGDARIERYQAEQAAFALDVGRTPERGRGLKVTLDDAHRPVSGLPQGFTADDIVVHQADVQGVVNALWAGGATAIAVQDQRLISTSAVRCVGNTLLLQGRVYSPPYVVTAVGDVPGMRRSLDADDVVSVYRDYARKLGLTYEAVEMADVTVPAFEGSVGMKYARVATGNDGGTATARRPGASGSGGGGAEPSPDGSGRQSASGTSGDGGAGDGGRPTGSSGRSAGPVG